MNVYHTPVYIIHILYRTKKVYLYFTSHKEKLHKLKIIQNEIRLKEFLVVFKGLVRQFHNILYKANINEPHKTRHTILNQRAPDDTENKCKKKPKLAH